MEPVKSIFIVNRASLCAQHKAGVQLTRLPDCESQPGASCTDNSCLAASKPCPEAQRIPASSDNAPTCGCLARPRAVLRSDSPAPGEPDCIKICQNPRHVLCLNTANSFKRHWVTVEEAAPFDVRYDVCRAFQAGWSFASGRATGGTTTSPKRWKSFIPDWSVF